MLKKLFASLGAFSVGAFAHVKPFPHEHVGFLHLEDILVVGFAVAVAGVGLFFLRKLVSSNEKA